MNLRALLPAAFLLLVAAESPGAPGRTIMAGGENDLPADRPSLRVDAAGEFAFVGALSISNGSQSFFGSGVALSRDWILTAGHNADLDDDGLSDSMWSATFYLPSLGQFSVSRAFVHPDFTGFANPFVNDDLALFRLATPLPSSLLFPSFGAAVGIGAEVTLVGFGRSGYGDYGYTTSASLTTRRFGGNVIDSTALDDEGSGLAEVFRYDFDAPTTFGKSGGSLGNNIETIIGPGDSGGPVLFRTATGWDVAGINTFTDGYGGRFGDTGGGVLVAPYREWIVQTTSIPEPSALVLLVCALAALGLRRKGRG